MRGVFTGWVLLRVWRRRPERDGVEDELRRGAQETRGCHRVAGEDARAVHRGGAGGRGEGG